MTWPRSKLLAAVVCSSVLCFPREGAALVLGPDLLLPDSQLAPVGPPPAPWSVGTTSVGKLAVSRCGGAYLVVWGSLDGGISAARVSLTGDLLDAVPLRLAAVGTSPSVASNGSTCLVAWASPTLPTAILATRLTPDLAVLDASPLTIATGTSADASSWFPTWVVEPQVSTDGVGYLVSHQEAWYEAPGVVATPVSADGQVGSVLFSSYQASFDGYRRSWAYTFGGGGWLFTAPDLFYTGIDAQLWAGQPLSELAVMSWASVFDHVSAATDGARFLALFNTTMGWSGVGGHPNGLRAVWLDPAGGDRRFSDIYDPSSPDSLLLRAEPHTTDGGVLNALAFDGRKYLAVWLEHQEAPTAVSGALLPAADDGAPATAVPLFSGAASIPALASSGRGVTLLAYAAPDAPGGAWQVHARLLLSDSTPPVVKVPAPVSATATTRFGAVVTYTATAQDDYVDALSPTCFAPSGSRFAPGTSRVHCLAADAAGNVGVGAFDVSVAFAWSGVLPPLSPSGSSVFKLGKPIPVSFKLVGASARIADLRAVLSLAAPGGRRVSPHVARFDHNPRTGIYSYALDTRALWAGTWRASIDLGDGVSRTVAFTLTR